MVDPEGNALTSGQMRCRVVRERLLTYFGSVKMARQNTLVRRRQTVEAARHLIAIEGMEGVTIDAIAKAVGLSGGAIYRHFAGNRQILLQLMDDIDRNLLDAVAEAQLGDPAACADVAG